MAEFNFDWDRDNKEPDIYELVVEGDMNDADYVTAINPISQYALDAIVIPVAKLIAKRNEEHPRKHNWFTSEYGRGGGVEDMYPDNEDLMETFQECFGPYGEHGIHTIKSIEYYPLPEKVKLL